MCLCVHRVSLSTGIHGNVLDFAARLDVAIDVAHAVTYLHMYTGISSRIQVMNTVSSYFSWISY